MRALALLLVSIFPCAVVSAQAPTKQSNASTPGPAIRVSLLNISSQRRQLLLKEGVVNLPVAVRVDINSRIGATVHIVSDANRSVDERIVIKSGDDAHTLTVP